MLDRRTFVIYDRRTLALLDFTGTLYRAATTPRPAGSAVASLAWYLKHAKPCA